MKKDIKIFEWLSRLKDFLAKLSGLQKIGIFVFLSYLIVLLDTHFNLFHHGDALWGFYFPPFVSGFFNTLILAFFFSIFSFFVSLVKIDRKESFKNVYFVIYGLTVLFQSVLVIYGIVQEVFQLAIFLYVIVFALSTIFFVISLLISLLFKKLSET